MEKLKTITVKLLISFALISIGFALGKNSVNHGDSSDPVAATDGTRKDYIAVYYMHATFRCSSCNAIETMTKRVLDDHYSQELIAGRIRWQEVNFQENEALAKQFGIISSCVVVAQFKDGVVIKFQRLDKVWTLMSTPKLFNQYIAKAVTLYLQTLGGGK